MFEKLANLRIIDALRKIGALLTISEPQPWFCFFSRKKTKSGWRKQNPDGGPLIVRRARIVRRAPILRRFANSSKHAFSNVFLMGRSKICISYLFAWFKNVQYALITLICDVKEILEVLFSV